MKKINLTLILAVIIFINCKIENASADISANPSTSGKRFFGHSQISFKFMKGELTSTPNQNSFSSPYAANFSAMDFDNLGILYCIDNSNIGVVNLFTVDTITGAFTSSTVLTGLSSTERIYGMAFNTVDNKMYISTHNDFTGKNYIHTLDQNTGSVTFGTLILNVSFAISEIAINAEGKCYGIDSDNKLFQINLTNGSISLIKSFAYLAESNYAGLSFEKETGLLWYSSFNQTVLAGELRSIDVSSGVSTLVATYSPFEIITGLAIPFSGYLNLSLIIQGFYDLPIHNMRMSDTATVILRKSNPPYIIKDISKAVIDKTSLIGNFYFKTAQDGNYFLEFEHRNSVETWSRLPVSFTDDGFSNYSFLPAESQAYGNNLLKIDSYPNNRYAVYSGDVNKDGIVDINDLEQIDNDAFGFTPGYVPTDVNGDNFVDINDISIAENNALNFVGRITPP